MKIGVHTLIWDVEFTPAHLPLLTRLKAAGFDGVEIPIFDPSSFDAKAVRKGFADNGLECITCSIIPQGTSLVSEDRAVRAKALTHLRDIIKTAADLDSRVIAGPLYSPVSFKTGLRRTADEWKRAVEAYQSVTGELEANNVTLAIEPLNRFETYFLNTAADAARLFAEVNHPRVGVSYDTFHSNIEDKGFGDAIRTIGKQLKYVQISENDRGTPGSGHVPWTEVLAALRDVGYDGWLTIESFAANLRDFSAAVCIWRDIEPVTESIAFDGIKFLRTLIK